MTRQHPIARLETLALIAVGGVAGATLRLVATAPIPDVLGITVANVVAATVLGLLVFGTAGADALGRRARLVFTTGLLSSLSTYSGFALETALAPDPLAALAVVGANYGLGFAGVLLGAAVGRWVRGRGANVGRRPFAALVAFVGVSALVVGVLAFEPVVGFSSTGWLERGFLVAVGGALGAICRHLVYESIQADRLPLATLAVNVAGSVALGLVVFSGAGAAGTALLGTGFCGAFTTFSTFAVETVRLWTNGDRRLASANAIANLACSVAGIGAAWALVAVA